MIDWEKRALDAEAALQEIALGKKQVDNEHPRGSYAGMAMRFITIAQKALKMPRTSQPSSDPVNAGSHHQAKDNNQ